MFTDVQALPSDPLLNLSRLFAEDTRTDKIDVGIGVYQDSHGQTPIMRAVKQAEQRVWQTQSSKKYLGVVGNEAFDDAIGRLVMGNTFDDARMRVQQTIAGTGAIRLIAETLATLRPQARVWVPDWTWSNHVQIFAAVGYEVRTYPYYDSEAAALRRGEFLDAMRQMDANDIVILHGCCHNPTGEDLNREDWQALVEIASERGFIPVVDLAYLGFGESIDADAYGLRLLAQHVQALFVGVSCSKNFGLYRDRIGAAILIAENTHVVEALMSHVGAVSRAMISMPADHGAAVVAEILNDEALRREWLSELEEMATTIRQYRARFADALYQATGDEWSFLTRQQGMFSQLPLGQARVERLRTEYGIYAVGAGRVNIAGLRSEALCQQMAQAIAEVRQH